MAQTAYDYSIANDTLNGKVAPDKLRDQIQDSSIVTALDGIITDSATDLLRVIFKDALSVGDETILDTVVADHDGIPYPPAMDVSVTNFATLEDPDHEIQRVIVQPARTGYYMCNRDIRLNTAIHDAADSFADAKVDPTTNVLGTWDEVTHVGCFKLDGGNYVQCADQADADTNAVLSVWDYLANDQTPAKNPIDYDLKGGVFFIDSALADDADKWKHQMYVMMAPNIPASMGGRVTFFDGYMWPYRGTRMDSINTMAREMNPYVTPEAARVRVWIYYPAGVKLQHVMRIITFRKVF
jgi:hypothetical protein